MANDDTQRSGRGFLPVKANLQLNARNTVEWVPRYQLAPRNQVDSSSVYVPEVTCAIDELTFDAHVSSSRGQRPHYHFSVAAPLALTYVALALTATEEFMSDVPLNRSLTVREDPQDTRVHSFVDYRYLRHAEDGVRILRRTDDSSRYPVGDSLFALALQFIALHEEGHYLNGHLDPTLGFCERGTYSERRNISSAASKDELLTSRALELDADHFATSALLAPLCSSAATEYISATICELGRVPLGFMRFVGCASMMLGLILWQVEGGVGGPPAERRTHPTPLCRILHFAHLVSRFVSVLAQNDEEAQAWNETVNRDASAILNMFGFKGVFDFRPEADTTWRSEWRETRQRLIEIKPGMSDAAARAREAVGVDPQRILPGDLVDLLRLE